jgi:hypothetical protein
MVVWVIAFTVSLIVTLGMGAIFVFFALILLNGYTSMAQAMPVYLICNCVVWPIMVVVTTAIDWGIFALAKQKQPIWQIGLLNALVVTICLGVVALIFYFT